MPPTPSSSPRHDRLDALRAVAIVWMALFHFGFDLAHFKLIEANFRLDPVWTLQRSCIVSLFLFCAGIGQAVAVAQGQSWPRFWRRWAQVAGCALLVSAGSAIMFPRSWISFGVLHGIAVMLIVARLSAGWGRWLWPLGLAALLLPQLVQHPFFDTRPTNWVGLTTRKPYTEDWVPLLPWLGVLWWGMAAGRWVTERRPGWLAGALPALLAPLAVLGRWSLSFYMLHQPLLIGALLLWLRLTGRA
ncbi:MAG TPA: heparan-alpha-glucosaminide N-acetyltransferase [Methylibium sp.]|nr:heparan-alpha-glucosaminide N-acetyltransferase [Methylibium sp.]